MDNGGGVTPGPWTVDGTMDWSVDCSGFISKNHYKAACLGPWPNVIYLPSRK